jgi:hypothetical protein
MANAVAHASVVAPCVLQSAHRACTSGSLLIVYVFPLWLPTPLTNGQTSSRPSALTMRLKSPASCERRLTRAHNSCDRTGLQVGTQILFAIVADHFGRRFLVLTGAVICTFCVLLIGGSAASRFRLALIILRHSRSHRREQRDSHRDGGGRLHMERLQPTPRQSRVGLLRRACFKSAARENCGGNFRDGRHLGLDVQVSYPRRAWDTSETVSTSVPYMLDVNGAK